MYLIAIMIICCLPMIFILWMIFKAHHDVLDFVMIKDKRLPAGFEGFKIFFITDIHRRKIKAKTLDAITDSIELVLIGGDMTEHGVPLDRTKQNLQLLKRFNVPIYFVWGNNDLEVNQQQLMDLFAAFDVIILADDFRKITRNGSSMQLIGFNFYEEPQYRYQIPWEDIDGYSLLLTHTPRSFYFQTPYIQYKIQTVLAGHTHGGQIRLFNKGLYSRGGLKYYNHTNVFVSEGYGYTALPFRLQTNAECHVVTLSNID
ncbi:metallophosphoesterase [Ornithinibacillus sp. 4-3]|uniref:Metallophosphoesterase n=1 Tax=Ornithinibacillus sp. 4-3 TaxID=3231488 RepID=A0AB39HH86_9BACI